MLRLRTVLPIMLVPLFLIPAAGASSYPHVISLPDDWGGEGIATAGHTFYVGSLIDGDIYRGDLRTGAGSVFIDETGKMALGLKVDRRHGLLFVAGGFDGTARVYDVRTGAELASYSFGAGTQINDVVVTRRAAYFTNSFGPQLFKVPIFSDGSLGDGEPITVTGPAAAPHSSFGLNGIAARANGKTLIVNHSEFGRIYTVDPRTGASAEIAVTGGSLTPTTLDGLLLVGHRLWVVENFVNRLTQVRLSPDWTTAHVTKTVTDEHFRVPATVARHGRRLAAVNTNFDLGFPPPLGVGWPEGTPFTVVQLKP